MDGRKKLKNKSLQKDIWKWLSLTTIVFVGLSSIVIGFISFYEAREYQDELLSELAKITSSNVKLISENYSTTERELEEESIVVEVVDDPSSKLQFTSVLKEGYSTLFSSTNEEEWRVLVLKAKDETLFYVAQPTEARNEIAINTCLSFIIPTVILLILMLITIYFILKTYFKPLNILARDLEHKMPTELKVFSENHIFLEILPFIKSINAFLQKSNEYVLKQHRFISDAAHELRTPIAGLALVAENLEKSRTEEDRLEKQKLLSTGLERLKRLVAQLLDLARLQADENCTFNMVSFKDTIKEVISEVFEIAKKKNIDFNVEIEEDLYVKDYKGILKSLVSNAIENAIRYSFNSTHIEISLKKEYGKAVLIIINNAPNILEDDFHHIWEPFFRPEGNKTEGTGLGLAICLETARKLKGSVSLNNIDKNTIKFKYEQAI